MAKNRLPRASAVPEGRKDPTTGSRDPEAIKHKPISWGLKQVDLDGEWSWRKVDSEHLQSLHEQLAELEGKPLWHLLRSNKVKDIPARHLRRKAQSRLKEIGLEERDTLWELRLLNKWRAWGLVNGSVFHFLWWDEFETVCNPPPKGKRRR